MASLKGVYRPGQVEATKRDCKGHELMYRDGRTSERMEGGRLRDCVAVL